MLHFSNEPTERKNRRKWDKTILSKVSFKRRYYYLKPFFAEAIIKTIQDEK